MNYSKTHPIALENSYRYTARDGTCRDSSVAGVVSATSNNNVAAKSIPALKAAIEKGPVSVTVEADRSAFQRYTGGILNSTACGQNLDHAITAVGWGSQNGQDYYIVRNSWGSSWGDRGYINIAAVQGAGICGIQLDALYPETD